MKNFIKKQIEDSYKTKKMRLENEEIIELIKEEIGEYPILLLDDVLSELDDQRKTKLLDILNNRIQTFITTTSIDGIEHHVIKEAKKININHREEK